MTLAAAFARDGLVRIPDAIPSGELAAMRDELRRRLATLEVVEIAGMTCLRVDPRGGGAGMTRESSW